MKAMSQTLYLVVAVVVILVTAVIILAIFWQGVTPAMGIAEAKSICQTQAAVSCATFVQMPPTWSVDNMRVSGDGKAETKSCAQIMTDEGYGTCSCNKDTRELDCTGKGTAAPQNQPANPPPGTSIA